MPVVGIIAEYNPLHQGHVYHILQSKHLTQAKGVICAMSGNFTQRGEPALVNKWIRTEMALLAGADLVFELPVAFAVRSAYHFARGAVLMLQNTGVCTHLSFGTETGNLSPLKEIASILVHEPDEYRKLIKKQLDKGASFPEVRARALTEYLKGSDLATSFNLSPLLAGPNNILAMEYLRVLKEENSSLIPLTLPRKGSGYYEPGNTKYSSATYIRQCLMSGSSVSDLMGLPRFSQEILKREFAKGSGPIHQNALGPITLFLTRRASKEHLAGMYDINEGLQNRIKNATTSDNLEELIVKIKTRRYSRTRIQRILLYILLNITKERARAFDNAGPQYLRLLGFSPKGQKILQEMKSKSRIPIITKVRRLDYYAKYGQVFQDMLNLDLLATDLHCLLQPEPRGGGLDFTTSPVIKD